MSKRGADPGNLPTGSKSGLLSRRRALGLGATLGLIGSGLLTACSADNAVPETPLEPDELSIDRAITAARTLHTAALAVARSRPELATLLGRVAAVHADHLVALGAPASARSTSSPTPSASATTGPPTATSLVKAEIAAARAALRDGLAAAPAFGLLLTRIAAARIANADLLSTTIGRAKHGVLEPAAAVKPAAGSTAGASATSAAATSTAAAAATAVDADPADVSGLPTPSTAPLIAVDRLLAGQNAAVFAYPLIIARAGSSRRSLATALWQAHRNERDELSIRLLAAGVKPTPAEPAYAVGTLPTTSAKAVALAARVERGLAALASDLVAAGTAGDADRALGADVLILAARRTASWTARPAAFPGQTRTVTATPTPTPTP